MASSSSAWSFVFAPCHHHLVHTSNRLGPKGFRKSGTYTLVASCRCRKHYPHRTGHSGMLGFDVVRRDLQLLHPGALGPAAQKRGTPTDGSARHLANDISTRGTQDHVKSAYATGCSQLGRCQVCLIHHAGESARVYCDDNLISLELASLSCHPWRVS